MKQALSLDTVHLFLAVADAGGLAGAARITGASVPTLSRKMTELERQSGSRLFVRGAQGYALTANGRAFRAAATGLRPLAQRLAGFAAADRPVRVRITAGHWTARFLARHFGQVWSADMGWVPEFLPSNRRVDIARREADIGVRNARPDQDWLAGRRTARIAFAPFAATSEVRDWITLPEDVAMVPSQQWVWQRHRDAVVTTASDARLGLDLALAGIGQVVLPLFAGETEQGLVQTGPVIADLSHDEWLVSHHDARHDPPVRAALEAVGRLLTDRALRPPPETRA